MGRIKQKRLPAELWDKMHYLFRDFNDRMVHAEIHYDYKIDLEVLKTTLICALEKAPVFHSSFHDNRIKPYWVVNEYTIDDVLTVKEVAEDEVESAVNEFLTSYIPPDSLVQMKALLIYHGEKSVLCFIENHMCMDGGDFKHFLLSFVKNYNDYLEHGKSPIAFLSGDRDYEEVYGDFKPSDQRMAKNLYRNINKKDNHGFPFTPDSIRDKSFIARRKIGADKFDLIKKCSHENGCSINDVFLAAYFYSMYQIANFNPYDSISISCAIDLRRHMDDDREKTLGYTNQTAWMQCFVPERGRDIFQTLKYAHRATEKFKHDKFMGLHGLPLLSFGYRIMPLAASEPIIKIGYSNPLLSMSNIGILHPGALALDGHEPTDAFMSGAVKYKPYALLTLTSFRGEFTLSMCCRGNDDDRAKIDKFFDYFEDNINTLISAEN